MFSALGLVLPDLSHPGGDPAVVGPDVVAPPRDALEPVEEPGGLQAVEPDLRPERLDLAPLEVDGAFLEPALEGLAHPDLALPVGSPVSPLSGDHGPPFSGISGPVCIPPRGENCRTKHLTLGERLGITPGRGTI